jgi:hypothetical protein
LITSSSLYKTLLQNPENVLRNANGATRGLRSQVCESGASILGLNLGVENVSVDAASAVSVLAPIFLIEPDLIGLGAAGKGQGSANIMPSFR